MCSPIPVLGQQEEVVGELCGVWLLRISVIYCLLVRNSLVQIFNKTIHFDSDQLGCMPYDRTLTAGMYSANTHTTHHTYTAT